MTYEIFLALAGFALSTVISPGPNNLMLMASGANFGFRRTIPHMLGVGLGFPLMLVPVGLGVMQLFELFPVLTQVMTVVSVAYMLWLAWKVANASAPGEGSARSTPMTFLQAAAFQWVNPKAWTMALGAVTLYATDRTLAAVLWVAGTYVLMGCISTTTWTVLGQQLRRILTNPTRLRLFNWSMAAMLLGSLLAVFWV
ncbi:LysE family translocator [Epibacterium sp. SM1969]|uniref:LysE family translocator n=1 Tax=Tritonibacter aquimaris TaxID=2663379 RepID=A0A844AZ96_9RHOB|nr:LysE family translocator [Tritonibacter aquimaris]MQY42486.1 LysE family translocator [Tritonibacter aquimaris]